MRQLKNPWRGKKMAIRTRRTKLFLPVVIW